MNGETHEFPQVAESPFHLHVYREETSMRWALIHDRNWQETPGSLSLIACHITRATFTNLPESAFHNFSPE